MLRRKSLYGAIGDGAFQHGLGDRSIRCFEEGVAAIEVDDGHPRHLAKPTEIPVDVEFIAIVTVFPSQLFA